MNIKSDQLCCYLEGIKVPIKSIQTQVCRNKLTEASIVIPISDIFIDKLWANALIQVTYIEENGDIKKEKLLFQGLCKNITTFETEGRTEIMAESVWSSLNFNTTLDYISPRKYGLTKIDDGVAVCVGTENVILPILSSLPGYQLSWRIFWLERKDDQTGDEALRALSFNDPDALKIEFIAHRTPFADRYAFSFFEDLAYNNFLLSRSYIERFNLLSKSNEKSKINTENLAWYEKIGFGKVETDPSRVDLVSRYEPTDDPDVSTGIINPKIGGTATGIPTNLVDYMENDPRKKYISSYVSKDRQWGDKRTCERILQFAEEIYKAYNQITMVGDICCYDSTSNKYYSPTMRNGKNHKTHNDGSSADIDINTITDMYLSNYNSKSALGALDILINKIGTRSAAPSVYFMDTSIIYDKKLQGMVKSVSGHHNHFHIFFVDRQL